MTSLTWMAYVSRKAIKLGGLGLMGLMLLWWLAGMGVRAYRTAHPPKKLATVRYGLLPKIVFPKKEFSKKNFIAELKNDAFPQFEEVAKVLVIYRPNSDFMALEHDRETARGLGFMQEPREVSPGVYEFRNNNLGQTLTMNVLDGSFVLKYAYQEDQTLLSGNRVPDKTEAIEEASNFLANAGKLGEDLKGGEKKVSYWRIEGNKLTAAGAQSEANVARVDFFRAKIDGKFKIVGDVWGKAPVSVLISGANQQARRIIEVNYKTLEIDEESYSTYPIKSVEAAWEDLSKGNYWPAADSQTETVAIREISLAYFEPLVLTNFLQPVYVFKGSDNFVAYVSAVADDKIKH